MSEIPEWFGPALAVARHQDRLSAMPWLFRWLHKILIARRCQCCIEYKKWRKP